MREQQDAGSPQGQPAPAAPRRKGFADHEPDRDQPEHESLDARHEDGHQGLVGQERQSLHRMPHGGLHRDPQEPCPERHHQERQCAKPRHPPLVVARQRHGERDGRDDPVDVARLDPGQPRDQDADRGQDQRPLGDLDRAMDVEPRPDVPVPRDGDRRIPDGETQQSARVQQEAVRSRERRIEEGVQEGGHREVDPEAQPSPGEGARDARAREAVQSQRVPNLVEVVLQRVVEQRRGRRDQEHQEQRDPDAPGDVLGRERDVERSGQHVRQRSVAADRHRRRPAGWGNHERSVGRAASLERVGPGSRPGDRGERQRDAAGRTDGERPRPYEPLPVHGGIRGARAARGGGDVGEARREVNGDRGDRRRIPVRVRDRDRVGAAAARGQAGPVRDHGSREWHHAEGREPGQLRPGASGPGRERHLPGDPGAVVDVLLAAARVRERLLRPDHCPDGVEARVEVRAPCRQRIPLLDAGPGDHVAPAVVHARDAADGTAGPVHGSESLVRVLQVAVAGPIHDRALLGATAVRDRHVGPIRLLADDVAVRLGDPETGRLDVHHRDDPERIAARATALDAGLADRRERGEGGGRIALRDVAGPIERPRDGDERGAGVVLVELGGRVTGVIHRAAQVGRDLDPRQRPVRHDLL